MSTMTIGDRPIDQAVRRTGPDPAASPFLRQMFECAVARVLVTDIPRCQRVYSSPSFDAMVGMDGRLPLGTGAPPPYVPSDQHAVYHGLLAAVPDVVADAGSVSGELVLLRGRHHRFRVDVTVGVLEAPRGSPLAVWLFRPRVSARDDLFPRSTVAPITSVPWAGAQNPDETALTRREREVLNLILDGWRVQSIAATLFVSEHTVRNHLKAIFRKLGAHSQKDLIEMVRSRQTSA